MSKVGNDAGFAALRDQPYALLQAMDARLRAARQEVADTADPPWTGLSFRLRDRWLVAPRGDIAEALPPPPLVRVPGAQPFLLGVANHHGNLLPVTDLGLLLDLPATAPHRDQRVLVLNSQRIPAGFLVDEIGGQRAFLPAEQRHELRHGTGSLEPWLLGVFVGDARPWLVLSLHKLARSERFQHAGL